MRNFGFADFDTVVSEGTNGKMGELSAAMGLTSLESLEASIAANRRNHTAYQEGLTGIHGLSLLPHDPTERHNFQYAVVEIDREEAGISRDLVHRVLWAENVLARRYFHPALHRMQPYRSNAPPGGYQLPNTDWLAVARSTSQKTGLRPSHPTAWAVATNVNEGISTSPARSAALAAI